MGSAEKCAEKKCEEVSIRRSNNYLIIVPTELYRPEAWYKESAERRQVNVHEM